jgi:hypothetical protein
MIVIDPVAFSPGTFSRASVACTYDAIGKLVEVPAGQMRLTYDPGNLDAPPCALIEDASANLLLAPRRFDNPAWGKYGTIVLPFQALAPDGTMGAYKLVETTVNAGHYMEQGPAIVATEPYSRTWIVRQAEAPFIRLEFYSHPTTSVFAHVMFRFSTGEFEAPVVALGVQHSYTARRLAGGWWALTQTVTLGTPDTRCLFRITLMSAAGTTVYAGDGVSGVYLWHAQLESGLRSTSVIPDVTTFVSRASARTYVAADGTIKVAAANVAAYEYAVTGGALLGLSLEPAANNFILNSDIEGTIGTQPTGMSTYLNPALVTAERWVGPNGKSARHVLSSTDTNCGYYQAELYAGGTYTTSVWVYIPAGNTHGVLHVRPEGVQISAILAFKDADPALVDQWQRIYCTYTLGTSGTVAHVLRPRTGIVSTMFGEVFYSDAWQCESAPNVTSYIQSGAGIGFRAADVANLAVAVRAADVVGSGPALLYSNVPITEPNYSATTTYAKGALVLAAGTPDVYESLVDANKGSALTDTGKWLKRKEPTNRWRMLDQYNNTQTTNPERIVLTLSPQLISQGVYLGNVDANEVSFVVQDLQRGVVYTETQNLIVSTSKSSFFKWCFGRIRRRSYAVSVMLPVYANAIVTVILSKPGATPACGMCAIGPLVDVGLSEYGLSAEIKDYSSTTFNFDGTSETVQRGYSKRMSVDVEVDDDQADAVFEALVSFRQKPVVYLGSVMHGLACVFGKFSSFKIIVASKPLAKASLQIEGTV